MKYYILFGVLLIHSFISAQLTDTTCIKSRWISLKPNEINKPLFSHLEDGSHVLFFIKELMESDKMRDQMGDFPYFNERARSWLKYDWNSKETVSKFDTIFANKSTKQFYIVCPESTIPVSNSFGEDSVYTEGGNLFYVYPIRTNYYIDIEKLSEILIHEDRVFNVKENRFEFQAVKIGFIFTENWGIGMNDLFWIDLEELCKQLESKGFYQWSKFVKEKRYSGFQYAQKSCYDGN